MVTPTTAGNTASHPVTDLGDNPKNHSVRFETPRHFRFGRQRLPGKSAASWNLRFWPNGRSKNKVDRLERFARITRTCGGSHILYNLYNVKRGPKTLFRHIGTAPTQQHETVFSVYPALFIDLPCFAYQFKTDTISRPTPETSADVPCHTSMLVGL